jgi:hypothetical protein
VITGYYVKTDAGGYRLSPYLDWRDVPRPVFRPDDPLRSNREFTAYLDEVLRRRREILKLKGVR